MIRPTPKPEKVARVRVGSRTRAEQTSVEVIQVRGLQTSCKGVSQPQVSGCKSDKTTYSEGEVPDEDHGEASLLRRVGRG